VSGKSRNRGFTLIEMMIVIAIVAIVWSTGVKTTGSLRWLTREIYYEEGLRQLRRAKEQIDETPFRLLPPISATVPPGGVIHLNTPCLFPGSVSVVDAGSGSAVAGFKVDEEKGRIEGLPAGRRVIVNYSFQVPETGEGAVVPASPPYEIRLSNAPARQILGLWHVEGARQEPIDGRHYSLNRGSGVLTLDGKYAGRLVRISYCGGEVVNRCSGEFLDGRLQPSARPAGLKLIRCSISYGGRHNLEIARLKAERQ
jgi:prepilin-type N-terminal cleavage/methylation domain-containing protein